MNWQVFIRYPNGQEKALGSYTHYEIALRRIEAIYSQGLPMQIGYVVRPVQTAELV